MEAKCKPVDSNSCSLPVTVYFYEKNTLLHYPPPSPLKLQPNGATQNLLFIIIIIIIIITAW